MSRKITRYSPKKRFSRRNKKRKAINFEKNDRFSLDPRVIKMRVEKDMKLFRKHRVPLVPTAIEKMREKIVRKLLVAIRYLLVLTAILKECEGKNVHIRYSLA